MTRAQLLQASREQLIAYLERWGYQCYDHETTEALRDAALINFAIERS